MKNNTSFAVFKSGGRQYLAKPGQKLTLELSRKAPLKVGEQLTFSEVVLAGAEGSAPEVGSPALSGRSVTAKVTALKKGPKLVIFKKRRRQRYVKKQGYRTFLTEVVVENIA